MKKTIKTLTLLVSGLVLLSCVVVVVNQTAGVVHLARDVHPAFGTVTLWVLLVAYGGLIARSGRDGYPDASTARSSRE